MRVWYESDLAVMHRYIARCLVSLVLTCLLVSAARPAPLPAWTGHVRQPPVLPPDGAHSTPTRRCRRHPCRPPSRPPASPLESGDHDRDPGRPPAARGTRRGRRDASARRRGCRGGQTWRPRFSGGGRRYVLVGALNIQSLLPKIAALQHDELHRLNYDFFIITETWLKSATPTRLVTFPGYTLHRADRPGGSGFGGVATLCSDNYSGSVMPQPGSECAACQLESLWLRVRPPSGQQFTLAAVYRPPRRTAAALQADFHELEAQYQRVVLQYPGPVFIMGDLNCNMLDPTNSGKAQTV